MAWDAEAPTGALIARCPARYVFLSRPLLWYICEDKVCTIAQKQAKHTIDPVNTAHQRVSVAAPNARYVYVLGKHAFNNKASEVCFNAAH